MFKRILLPLDGSDYCDSATRQACMVAKAHDAEITGLVVLNTAEILDKERLPFSAQLRDLERKAYFRMKEEAQNKIDMILQKFRNTCKVLGVSHREAELQGLPSACILDESIYYDLIVIGMRTHFHLDAEEEGDSMEKILDNAIVPVLAVPICEESRDFKRILVAFNGSFHAAQALREFVRFSEPFDVEVKLLMSDKDDDHAEHCLNEAIEYLSVNGFHDVEQVWTRKGIIDAVESDHLSDVDLIVAGIHSKNRFKNFFVGSFTKKLIERGEVSLLLG